MTGPLALYTADEMRAVDAAAIGELGIPGAVLMERAGLAAAEEILRLGTGSRAAVVCGAGNNGGDGFVVARHLHGAGWEVECLLAGDARKLPPDARLNHDIVRTLGVEVADGMRRARATSRSFRPTRA
jgi:ADP-dependent NAD(P)H-hydrate dehydratase / NAD(P)H-hydrate epimerase